MNALEKLLDTPFREIKSDIAKCIVLHQPTLQIQEAAAAELEAKDKEIERLSNIIRAVDVASRRKLKDGETVYNILSAIQKILAAK
jgi:hypothetical protein